MKLDDIFLPWDEAAGKSKGYEDVFFGHHTIGSLYISYAFIELRSADDANLAIATMNEHPFDSKHRFKVNRFTDIEQFANIDETYVEPEAEIYVPRVRSIVTYLN